MKKCHKKCDFGECPSCPFIEETKVVKSTATNFSVEINTEVNCQTKGIIYCITCKKCSVQYIVPTQDSWYPLDPCEEIEMFDGDGKEHENDEDNIDMDEDQAALITESENLELGRLKEEY